MNASALADAVGAVEHSAAEITTPYGDGLRVELRFDRGWAKLDWYDELVFWQSARSETDAPTGLMERLHTAPTAFFKQAGVKRYLAAAGSAKAEAKLKKHGDWRNVDGGLLEWVL